MKIKKLKGEEVTAACKVQSVAFNFGTDFSKTQTKDSDSSFFYGAFNDAGKLCSCLEVLPFEAWLNGEITNMACIGGVSSLPEERGNGYVRALFYFALEIARSKKQWGSYLYPFSHMYYRKFGYELCTLSMATTIPLTEFVHFQGSGAISQYKPGDSPQNIIRLYENFSADKNFMIHRSTDMWEKLLSPDPYKNMRYIYTWHNGSGIEESYVIIRMNHGDNTEVKIEELIWTTAESLNGIFAFMKTFSASYKNFVWMAPDFLNLRMLFEEPYTVKSEVNCSGMFRIVDVEQIFSRLKPPVGTGEITVKVHDTFLPWNDGVFGLSWDAGGFLVTRSTCEPDMTCNIKTMAQLVSGYAIPDELELCGELKIRSNRALISKVFVKKKNFIIDKF